MDRLWLVCWSESGRRFEFALTQKVSSNISLITAEFAKDMRN